MGTREELLKVWDQEAERLKKAALDRLHGAVADLEQSLNKLVADWKIASDTLSIPAFELLAKGGKVWEFAVRVAGDRGSFYLSPGYDFSLTESTQHPELFLPQGSYRLVVLAFRKG